MVDLVSAAEIVDTLHEGLLIIDAELRVVQANRAFYLAFDVAPHETEGRLLSELGNGQWDIAALRARLTDILAGGPSFEGYEVTHAFPGLGARTMVLNARRMDGRAMVLLAIEDVTARKAAETAAALHARELARSNAELEQFAYVASHDLQEPLRAVVGYLQLIERSLGSELSPQTAEMMQSARAAAQRMRDLIRDLLAYSRAGRGDRALEPVDTNIPLAHALASLKTAIHESGALVTVGALPTITTNARHLETIFVNLVGNAIKFRRGPGPRIRVDASLERDRWVFAVADDGIGVPEDARTRVFEVFQRLHSRRDYPGTGIGLALVKRLVETHGGAVWIADTPGGGATVRFALPNATVATP